MCCENLKFYFSRSSFSREIYKTSFLAAVKEINLNKIKKKLHLQTLLFFVLKIRIPPKYDVQWKILPKKIQENHK